MCCRLPRTGCSSSSTSTAPSPHPRRTIYFRSPNKQTEILSALNAKFTESDQVMMVESEHPYRPTDCKRWVVRFDDAVDAVSITFHSDHDKITGSLY